MLVYILMSERVDVVGATALSSLLLNLNASNTKNEATTEVGCFLTFFACLF